MTGKYNDGTEFADEFNTVSVGLNYSCRILGRVAQLVTCLATDASLTADPGVTVSLVRFRPSPILSWRLIMK